MKSGKVISFLIHLSLAIFISCSREKAWEIVNQPESPTDAISGFITVVETTPSAGETYVSINSNIAVTFSDNIMESTLSDSSISVDNGTAPADISYDTDTKTVIYTPQDMLALDTIFTVTVSKEIKNPAGEGLAEEYSWSFTTASGLVPEISIYKGIILLNSGSTYDFGTIVYTDTRDAIFTIDNSGTGDLLIDNIVLGGTDPGEFIIDTGAMASPVSLGDQTQFTVTFDPSSTGNKSASVTVENNDDNESVYTFYIKGYASSTSEPEIMLMQGATEYIVGDNYDFGTVLAGTSSPTVTFTIYNIGSADLSIGSFTLEGQNIYMFILDESGTAPTVPAGSSTTFTACFAPDIPKVVLVRVLIENNDSDEDPFMFKFKARSVE